jgi:hypothetical protein
MVDRRTAVAPLLTRWGRELLLLAGAVHLVAFYVALRRYVVGTDGPVWFLGRDGWVPPIPPAVLLVAFAGTLAATGWYLLRLSGGRPADEQRVAVPVGRDPGEAEDLVVG